nr:UDP-N-acetylmuramoyl-tripeptide--D-alanyl-D-alanine ligase [uncultured Rhodopila sp.]
MTLWTARDLAEATGGVLSAPFDAGGVSIDTRTLNPGDLFVALLGEGRDGHAFVANALAKGAAGAMVHANVSPAAPTLRVDDTLAGLTRLGGFARARFAGRLVAVTGSVGKTTTKEMLRAALSAFGPTHAAAASYNNHWGLPLTLALIPRPAQFCIAEIGMNHAGEIEPLARLARPHVAVITTIAKAHVGHLGSIEAIAAEKATITRGLEPNGIAVFPADSLHLPLLRAGASGATVVTFGSDASADVRLLNAEADADGSRLDISILGRAVRLRLNAPGRHMALNATATLATIAALGLDPAKAIAALEAFAPLSGRGARRELAIAGGTILLLDESYNGNGASVRAALDVLRLQPDRRRVAVLGDMLELGDEGPAEHASLADAVEQSADILFTCGPLMRHLHDSVPSALRGAHAADSNALAPIVAKAITDGDAVLVKGSLGSGMRRIIATLEAATSRASTNPAGAA